MKTLDILVSDMTLLIEWAQAYEDGESCVDDTMYDCLVRALTRDRHDHPDMWDEACKQRPEFTTNDFTYTGMFWKGSAVA